MEQRILHLVLKKQWFDMIASGEKKEEYRDVTDYWVQRLCKSHPGNIGGDLMNRHKTVAYTFRGFDLIKFALGYKSDRPFFYIEFKGIEVGQGKPEWGAEPEKEYFVIRLGNILPAKQPENIPQMD